MAERVVHGFERVLRAAVSFGLAEADIRQFALDHFDQVAVEAIGGGALIWRLLSASAARLACWCSRWRRMSCNPSSTRPRWPEPDPEEVSIRSSRYDTRCSRWAKAEAFRNRPACGRCVPTTRASHFRAFGIVACRGPFAAFQRRGQRGNALLEDREGIAVTFGAGELIDLGRERVDVLGQPRQRVVGGDIGDDRAKRRDRVFELVNRGRIVIGAQDQVELGAEIADRVVIAGELFGGRQRTQRLRGFRRARVRCWPAPGVGAVLPVVVDTTVQRADFILERFDRPARHRLGDGLTDLGEFAAEGGDRLLHMIGTLQRLDLARDLDEMPLERGEIRAGRRSWCCRRGRCWGVWRACGA